MKSKLWLIAGLCLLPALARAQWQVEFGTNGLQSIKVDGQERLISGTPVAWVTPPGDRKVLEQGFDAATRTLTQRYVWGTARYVYEVRPNELRIRVQISNTSTTTLTQINAHLLNVAELGDGQRLDGPNFSVEGPALVTGRGAAGALVWYNAAVDRPLTLDLRNNERKGVRESVGCTVSLGGNRIILDNITAERPIPPGATDEFTVGLRLGAGDPWELAADLLEDYRRRFPRVLKWNDRRPIVRAFFGGGLPKEQALARLKDPDNALLPEPDPKFQTNFFRKISACIENAKSVNAQGIILWDLEGETFPHAVTYIGDPRLIRILNPQMELVIDEGMRRLKEAGLQVGITIRPSRVIYNAEKHTAMHSHTVAGDPLRELDGKIAYARQRWGATIFYIDTNYFWRPYGEAREWKSAQIPAAVYRQLLAKYPDILLIPEFGQIAAYDATIPYGEADMGNWGTPELARRIWPEACRVIVIEDADPLVLHDRFVKTVREGNLLMTQVGGGGNNLAAMKRIYEEAATPAPDLTGMPVEELLKLALDPAAPWLKRKAALVALADKPHSGAVAELLALVTDRPTGLSHFAGRALVRQGTNVVPAVMEQIRQQTAPWPVSALGEILVELRAADAAPALQDFYTGTPKLPAGTRRELIQLIGRLRNPTSEEFLLTAFRESGMPLAAAEALVRIGSAKGVEEIKAAIEAARQSGNKEKANALGRALQAN